jgi:hypothetical protein
MMGEQRDNQQRLFYSFNLDEHVPAHHPLRGINQFLDLSDLRSYLAPFYSHTGRPSIDPELMIRMLIVGYCFGIRSERRLCGVDRRVDRHSSRCCSMRHTVGRFRGAFDLPDLPGEGDDVCGGPNELERGR